MLHYRKKFRSSELSYSLFLFSVNLPVSFNKLINWEKSKFRVPCKGISGYRKSEQTFYNKYLVICIFLQLNVCGVKIVTHKISDLTCEGVAITDGI